MAVPLEPCFAQNLNPQWEMNFGLNPSETEGFVTGNPINGISSEREWVAASDKAILRMIDAVSKRRWQVELGPGFSWAGSVTEYMAMQ